MADFEVQLCSQTVNVTVSSVGGSTSFVSLTDTPSAYTGQANKFVKVNSGEDALEFSTSSATASWGSITGTLTDQTDLDTALGLKADVSNVLELDNTDSFTPDADYEPATKKYVDDNSGGNVSTNGTPVDNDFAKFVNGTDIEGRSYAEVRTDLGLVIGTNVQAYDSVLDNTTASYTTADETKIDFISVTQAVNLDTIESDTATNNAKVTNATHSGEVTGDTALTIADNVVDEANLKLDEAATNDYVLTADSTKSGGMKWASVSAGSSPLTTKGDVYTYSTTDARLPVGTNGQILSADSTESTGLKWITASGSGDVTGPASSTDDNLVTFDSTTGKLIQDSGINISAVIANTAKVTYPSVDSTKVGFITVTQAVDLDTMESNIATNNAKVSYPGSADATELNILDGATLSTTELNYVDGVTSSIQDQLDAKGTMDDLVDDTTPTLGGDLVGDDKNITGVGCVSFTQELDNGSKTTDFSVDFATDQKQKATLTANTITLTFDTTNVGVGNYILKLVNGGLATLTWASESGSIFWAGGTEPTFTSSGTDIIAAYFDGTNWYCVGSLDFS